MNKKQLEAVVGAKIKSETVNRFGHLVLKGVNGTTVTARKTQSGNYVVVGKSTAIKM